MAAQPLYHAGKQRGPARLRRKTRPSKAEHAEGADEQISMKNKRCAAGLLLWQDVGLIKAARLVDILKEDFRIGRRRFNRQTFVPLLVKYHALGESPQRSAFPHADWARKLGVNRLREGERIANPRKLREYARAFLHGAFQLAANRRQQRNAVFCAAAQNDDGRIT